MQDRIGNTVKIGDSVLFTKGQRSDYDLYTGVITEIHKSSVSIKNLDTSRIIRRNSDEFINIEPFKNTNPELFI